MTQEISLITAFIAGFLSFFAPCILPLIPPYFAWLLGISEKEVQKRKIRLTLLWHGFLLILGFSVIFIILGASASKIGQFLAPYRLLAQKIGGLIIVLFGLKFIGLFKISKASLAKKIFDKLDHKTSSFFVGSSFAFAWVACFSPILGSILVLSSFQGTLLQGLILLSFYSLGLALPFLLSALVLELVIKHIKAWQKITKWVNLFSGLILIIIGLLLLTDNFYKIVIWLSKNQL